MGFLDRLSRLLGPHRSDPAGHDYDRVQWRKKLTRVLDQLPDSQGEWGEVESEARALGLDPAWVRGAQREEFSLLMRRVVADGAVTGMEHRKLDLARDLIGLSDSEAEVMLETVIADAETFFGKPVQDR